MIYSLISAIAEGIGLGLTLAILTGPAFFALLQTSIRNGYKSGIAFSIGVFLSDATLILLSYQGALRLFSEPKNSFIIGIVGGTILIMFGIFNVFQKHPLNLEVGEEKLDKLTPQKVTLSVSAMKGFAINLINPFVIIFWVGVVSVESARYKFSSLDVFSVFCSALLTVLSTDILKSMAAQKITSFLSPQILIWVNRIAGVILIISGFALIWKVGKTFL